MNEHLSSASLKAQAKGQLLGKYGTAVAITAVFGVCTLFLSLGSDALINTNSLAGLLMKQVAAYLFRLIIGVLAFGFSYVSLKVCCGQVISVKDIFYGFSNNPNKVIGIEAVIVGISFVSTLPANLFTYFVIWRNPDNIYLLLPEVILIIAGVIIAVFLQILFSQCHYLLLDFPQYSPREILYISRKIMEGNKGRLLYLHLSFIPLYLLCAVGYYIPLLWVYPYMQVVLANFYMDIVRKDNQTKA